MYAPKGLSHHLFTVEAHRRLGQNGYRIFESLNPSSNLLFIRPNVSRIVQSPNHSPNLPIIRPACIVQSFVESSNHSSTFVPAIVRPIIDGRCLCGNAANQGLPCELFRDFFFVFFFLNLIDDLFLTCFWHLFDIFFWVPRNNPRTFPGHLGGVPGIGIYNGLAQYNFKCFVLYFCFVHIFVFKILLFELPR